MEAVGRPKMRFVPRVMTNWIYSPFIGYVSGAPVLKVGASRR